MILGKVISPSVVRGGLPEHQGLSPEHQLVLTALEKRSCGKGENKYWVTGPEHVLSWASPWDAAAFGTHGCLGMTMKRGK